MKDVMVDLETLGTTAGDSIISIGAVYFDQKTQELGDEFHIIIDRQSCREIGLLESVETIAWWDKQSDEAKKTLVASSNGEGATIYEALVRFSEFMKKGRNLWGNGSDFDNVLLAAVYQKLECPPPWKFYNNRCYRTLKSLRPDVKLERIGTYHNALDDAKTQAVHAMKIFGVMSYGN